MKTGSQPHPGRFAFVLAVVVAMALAFPAVANPGLVFLAGVVAINVVLGLSFNLLFSTAGLLSFGQSAFSAAGAYTTAVLLLKVPGLPFLLVLAASALVGAALALALGIIALKRTEGVYFAVLTLAFSALLHVVIAKTTALGRNDGLTGIPRPRIDLGVTSVDLAQGQNFYVFVVLLTAAVTAVLWWVTHSRLGRSFRAIRLDPMRAMFLGIDVRRRRLEAFAIAGATTALAGALIGPLTSIVSPDLAHWAESTKPILFTLLGGAGAFWGPAVGAVMFAGIEYGTRTLAGASDLITGGLLLAVVLAVPGGVLGLAARLVNRKRAPALAASPERMKVAVGGKP
jgi:branched-chain amino acid transport system permease protein